MNRNKSLVTNKEKDRFQGNPSFNQTTMVEKGKGRRRRKKEKEKYRERKERKSKIEKYRMKSETKNENFRIEKFVLPLNLL